MHMASLFSQIHIFCSLHRDDNSIDQKTKQKKKTLHFSKYLLLFFIFFYFFAFSGPQILLLCKLMAEKVFCF